MFGLQVVVRENYPLTPTIQRRLCRLRRLATMPMPASQAHTDMNARSAPLIAFGRISLASNIYVCVFIVFVVSLHEPQKLIPKL